MDPLSITLSVVSLATTLSDMLELALSLRESFQKISRNAENARRLASDVISTLQQLKGFYNEHFDILENSPAMRTAIFSLKSEMQAIHLRCSAMVPVATSRTAVQNAKTTFKSWINRKRVEEDIKGLKTRVNLCYIQFTTFATARVEASSRRIQDVATRIDSTTTRIENRIAILDQSQIMQFNALKGRLSFIDVGNVRHRNSDLGTSSTFFWQGIHIADDYLCSEIDAIDRTLQDLPSTQIVPAEPQGPYLRPFKPVIHVKPSPSHKPFHRRKVIAKTIDILLVFQKGPACGLSLQQGAWNLVNLSIGLYQLELYREATVVGLWAVNLFRILVTADANVYRPYLVISLHNLSQYHIAQNEEKESLPIMSECLKITRMLARESPTPEVIGLLARSLTESSRIASINQEYTRSLEESEEAVEVSDGILVTLLRLKDTDLGVFELDASCAIGNGASQRAEYGIQNPDNLNATTGIDDNEIKSTVLQSMHDYAQALHQLSYNLHRHERYVDAIDADKKALQIFRFIIQNHSIHLDADIAEILYHLTHQDFRLFVHTSEAIHYIQESIEIYRYFSIDSSNLYRKLLYHALYKRATLVRTMEDYAEEAKAWSEAVEIARLIRDDLLLANALYQSCWSLRHLDLLDEAVNMRMEAIKAYRSILRGPSQLEANAHYDLAVDLQLAHRHKEAKAAAQEAVCQYRTMALANPETSTEALADSITLLTSILLSTREVDRALDAGGEALRLFRFIVSQNPSDTDITSKYMHCLDVNTTAAFKLEDETKAIARSLSVVELFEELSDLCPEQDAWGLIGCWESHALLLNGYDRLGEARKWMEKAIDWFGTFTTTNSHEVERIIVCLCSYASILDNQGFREQALDSILKAVHLGKDLAHSNSSLASVYVASRVRQVDLLWELGRYHEAFSVSEDVVVFARRTQLADIKDFIECLLVHATVLNCNDRPERGIVIANEVIELCHYDSSVLAQENHDRVLQLSHALHALSESHAGLGKHDESLVYAQRCLDQIHELQRDLSPFRWSHLRYPRTIFSINLAERLATVGNYQRALELLLDARAFFEEFTSSRNGYYIELARVLRLIGLLHCSFKQHEEGVVAATSLGSLRKRLFVVFPSLACLVDKEFERKIRQPSWLKNMNITLDCTHQQLEITFPL